MTKQQVIDILEYFRPSRNKYCHSPVDDYVDDMIDSRIDDIIEFVKHEPDSEWIKCSEQMPEVDEIVLVYELDTDDPAAFNQLNVHLGLLDIRGDWYIDFVKLWSKESAFAWMPIPIPPLEF